MELQEFLGEAIQYIGMAGVSSMFIAIFYGVKTILKGLGYIKEEEDQKSFKYREGIKNEIISEIRREGK